MPAPTIALITPTLGRDTLARAIHSALPQLGASDEWWIVGDGPRPSARHQVESLADPRVRYLEHSAAGSTYGNAQRNVAMRAATAGWFVFLDDDDVLLPGALDAVRREAIHGVPLMFRMDYRPARTIVWNDRAIREGNVAGAAFVVPRVPGRWCEWPESIRPEIGDLGFIRQTLALWPEGSLRWCEDVLCRCDGHGRGK